MADVTELVRYGRWANLQVLRVVGTLSEVEFTKDLRSSFGSVCETLAHLLWAEQLWLERWRGGPRVPKPDRTRPQSLPDLERAFKSLYDAQMASIASQSELAAERVVSYVNEQSETWSYPLRDLVQHVAVHSAFHRGQIATLLRQLGKVPPHTDYLVYLDTKGARGA